MNTITNPAQSVNKSCGDSASVLHNSASIAVLTKPNLWIPDTEPDYFGISDKPTTPNNRTSTLTINRQRDGMYVICPCCGEIEPGFICDALTGESVRLTYDIWWRIARTYLQYLSAACDACGSTYSLWRTATIAKTAEAIELEAEDWAEFDTATTATVGAKAVADE